MTKKISSEDIFNLLETKIKDLTGFDITYQIESIDLPEPVLVLEYLGRNSNVLNFDIIIKGKGFSKDFYLQSDEMERTLLDNLPFASPYDDSSNISASVFIENPDFTGIDALKIVVEDNDDIADRERKKDGTNYEKRYRLLLTEINIISK